jgi:hypothetical protein
LSLVVCALRVHSRRLIKGLYIGKLSLTPRRRGDGCDVELLVD